jgi:hypothetical protein
LERLRPFGETMGWVETLPKSELPAVSASAAAVLDNGMEGLSVGVIFLDTDYDNDPLLKHFGLHHYSLCISILESSIFGVLQLTINPPISAQFPLGLGWSNIAQAGVEICFPRANFLSLHLLSILPSGSPLCYSNLSASYTTLSCGCADKGQIVRMPCE